MRQNNQQGTTKTTHGKILHGVAVDWKCFDIQVGGFWARQALI